MANPNDQKTNNLDLRDQKMRATIAQGRTIMFADPANQMIIGHDVDGKPIKRAQPVYLQEGNEIELPPDEVKRLRKIGFLVDPNVKPIPRGEGPSFSAEGRKVA
jgi:hypothetical protein